MIIRDLVALQKSTYENFETFYIRCDKNIEQVLTALSYCKSAKRITLFEDSAEHCLNEDAVNIILKSETLGKLDYLDIVSNDCQYDNFPATIYGRAKAISKSSDELYNRLSIITIREWERLLEAEMPEVEQNIYSAFVSTPSIVVETLQKYEFAEHKNDNGQSIHFSHQHR